MSFSDFKEVLTYIAQRNSSFTRVLMEGALLQAWDHVVGRAIAIHTEPMYFQEGILWVRVDHPIWQAELHSRRAQIYEKMIQYGIAKNWVPESEEKLRSVFKEIRFKVLTRPKGQPAQPKQKKP